MSSAPVDPDHERVQVRRCQQGDSAALADLRTAHHASLVNILIARGARVDETEELLADMWGDCVSRNDDEPSLLDKFSGKCSLQGWLATVATRRWIDLRRKQTRRGENRQPDDEDNALERLPAAVAPEHEDVLVDLLRDSLRAAFTACQPADMLMLRLVFIHGVSQRELMRMWGWSESKVSRQLSRAMQDIEKNTMQNLKQKDPWLELTWQDFLDLCETHQVGFL